MKRKINYETLGILIVVFAMLFFATTIMSIGLAPQSDIGLWSLKVWNF